MIHQNVPHDSSYGHVTGESIFVDDRPEVRGEVFVGIVGTPIAAGLLLEIDASEALAHEDCLAVYTHKDLVGKKWGTIVHDQPLLVEEKIGYKDEACALIVSKRRESVEFIKKLVKVKVKEERPITSIGEAKALGAILYQAPAPFKQGDAEGEMQKAPHRLSGVFKNKGQEHFYMESQAAIAYPLDHGQVEVHSSSQHPSETQRVIAEALGLPLNKVVCVVKRMGGGFGGKESQAAPIAAYAAVVAMKMQRAARLVLTKDQDMQLTGKRHPFENEWQVGFNDHGEILSLIATIQSDGGAYADLSASILERAMFHLDSAYYLPHVKIEGICYRTHHHPHTAFRGFGGPQGSMTIESILEDIAHHLKLDPLEVRRRNIYRPGKLKTPYGQEVENNLLPQIFDQLEESSDYQKRRQEIEKFNSENPYRKRGLSLAATKFGIAFTARFLNQGNALVNLHLDGTLQVSTGATEMGQGVNTKIAQVVAHALGVEMNDVQIMPTSTEKNHNTSPTAASSGADINAAAALKACQQIKARLGALFKLKLAHPQLSNLQEFKIPEDIELDPEIVFQRKEVLYKNEKIALKDLISLAYMNRISLGAYAHFKTENLGFCKQTIEGRAFNYYTQGLAISEVEIDLFTGDMKVLRTDILMDLGRPLNPGIDRGQVIGAFVQAQGWVTTEDLYYNEHRTLVSHSPTTYKIPNVQDIPREIRVDFIENHDNHVNVHRSKAVGEPPFLLGASVWTAIKDALSYCAKGPGLKSPATGEEILRELSGDFK
jgi:xanthine dehydrogenase large subunit